MILMFGQIIVLTLTVLPAVLAGLAAYLIAGWLFGKVLAVAVVSGALAAALVLAAEAALGVLLLGKAFERFDWSDAARPAE